jgi:hypothetical protein
MKLDKFKVVMTALVAASAVLLVAPANAGDKASAAFKLEGAWIARVVEVPGGQWTYTVSPDASGRHATCHGSIDVGLYTPPLDDMADMTSPLLIDVVITGPDTAKFNSIWYGIKKVKGLGTTAEVIYIGVNQGELKRVAPNKSEGTHNILFYLASADADHDGLPDPGATPVGGATVHTIDTRLPSPQ